MTVETIERFSLEVMCTWCVLLWLLTLEDRSERTRVEAADNQETHVPIRVGGGGSPKAEALGEEKRHEQELLKR